MLLYKTNSFKYLLLLISLVSIFSCSRTRDILINETLPEPETLEITIKNNSNITFLRTEVIASNTHLVFQQIEPNNYSGFYEVPAVYSEIEITIQTSTGYYSFTPNNYEENTLVTEGRFYFEVSISAPNNTLVITRKQF